MNSLLKNFGLKVKYYRKFCGLNQEKFAELVDLDPTTITAIETGKHFVKATTLERFCVALNVKPSDLFDFDIEQNPENNKLINQIIARAKLLTPQQQEQLIKIIDSFK